MMKSDKTTIDRKKQPTVIDVAKTADVAVGTVSRFLNGQFVRAAKRDRIERAIAELGYRRNMTSVAMKTGRTQFVGFLAPSLGEFHAHLLEQLSFQMRINGRAVLSFCHGFQEKSMKEAVEFFHEHRIDALITDGVEAVRADIAHLIADGLPIILYDTDMPKLRADRVFVDNRRASARIVKHLIDLGHDRIAIVHGPETSSTGQERLAGFMDALIASGIGINAELAFGGEWSEHRGYQAMKSLWAQPVPPTAVFGANARVMTGVLTFLREAGICVPEDISVVGFDDSSAFRLFAPGITTVGQPIEKIAQAIADTVAARLAGCTAPQEFRLDCDIILRGSTARPRRPNL